jgi:hypothetical protein
VDSTSKYPSSETRRIFRSEPLISTLDASETCGTPSRSASIAAITPIRASVDSEPQTTRSKPVCSSTLAIA